MLTNAMLQKQAQAEGPDGMVSKKPPLIRSLNVWGLLGFKFSSSGSEEGDFLTIETSWRRWMEDAETLLWINSDVR